LSGGVHYKNYFKLISGGTDTGKLLRLLEYNQGCLRLFLSSG
jgi:hypothetical protein